jgi:glucokinase
MKYLNDKRIVMTLDAGGTNFVFCAIQANDAIVDPTTIPAGTDNLNLCLEKIIDGFQNIKTKLKKNPDAISFAFPGPANYPKGIIEKLGNLPAFNGGVALGPMLKEIFKIPVFINNDGDLYAYGEAIAGFLPYINNLLKETKSSKHFNNLLGITLGTGFGAGIVRNEELFLGDNSASAGTWLLRNKLFPKMNVEENISIRGIQRTYSEGSKMEIANNLTPKEIYEIGIGKRKGNKKAALKSYKIFGEVVGDAMANSLALIDGIAAIGGGIAKAHSLFLPEIINEMNGTFKSFNGTINPRMSVKVFNLENEKDLNKFLRGKSANITIPKTNKHIQYDPLPRIGVGISKIGTNKAINLGAYAFALNSLDNFER